MKLSNQTAGFVLSEAVEIMHLQPHVRSVKKPIILPKISQKKHLKLQAKFACLPTITSLVKRFNKESKDYEFKS